MSFAQLEHLTRQLKTFMGISPGPMQIREAPCARAHGPSGEVPLLLLREGPPPHLLPGGSSLEISPRSGLPGCLNLAREDQASPLAQTQSF